MFRPFAATMTFLVVLTSSCFPLAGEHSKTLSSLTKELEERPDLNDASWVSQLEPIVSSASLSEIEQVLPSLANLSESKDAQQRANALLVMNAIAARQRVGLPENERERDAAAAQLVVPYIARLAPRLFDFATPNRSLSLLILVSLAAIYPAPPDLLATAINVLQDPRSTVELPDTSTKSS